MSLAQLTTEEYRRLVDIMANMSAWQSIQQRQVNLDLAGLSRFKACVNFDVETNVFCGALVSVLRTFGSEGGEPVLARLVRYLIELMGESADRTFLENLLGERAQQHSDGAQGVCTILFLSANPQHDLNLDREMRLVDDALQRARHRDKFKLEKQPDLQLGNLQNQLLRFQPHVVHFSGHGDGAGSLIVMDGERPVSVPPSALRDLFSLLKQNVRLVVLNSCFSQPLAEQLAQVIDCVIGTNDSIGDAAAIEFARALYGGLGEGKSVQTAFALGVNALDLRRYPDRDVPRLLTRSGVDANQVFFC